MKSKRSLEGYICIENPNNAPTLPGAVGYGVRGKFEAGTLTCCHCQAQVLVNPLRTRDRNHCAKCDRYVCDRPECNAACLPMKLVFEKAHTAAARDMDVLRTISLLRQDVLG